MGARITRTKKTMHLRCNLLLCLISTSLLIIQAQDPSLSKQNVMPYQASPSGLEQERKKLMYPVDVNDYISDIGVKSIHEVIPSCRIPFFGFDYQYMIIHKDGYITFNRGLLSYDFPIQFPIHVSERNSEEDPSLIAPWFSQQDIPRGVPDAGVYLRLVDLAKESNATLRERIIRDFREGMIGANKFTARCAMIVTWKNVTFANPRPQRPIKTNTYQVVIATDEKNTYAMFNYEWITWTTHMDNYEGIKGPQAFVGFNAGNITRAFEYQPYSQSPSISTLAERGFSNGIKGRHIFQITEEIYPGTCTPTDMNAHWQNRPLMLFPRSGSMLGGTVVNITGPCFPKNKKTIEVMFHYTKVQCAVQDENHATCISPTVLYHGYIDIFARSDDQQVSHTGKFYILPPTGKDLIDVSGESDRQVEPEMFELRWSPSSLSWNGTKQVKFHLWGYRETSGSPNLTYITELNSGVVHLSSTRYKLELKQFKNRDDLDKTDLTFGFISMNMSDSSVSESPIIWSRPMPLAWFFKPQWDREYGINLWRDRQCLNWHQKEMHKDRFTLTLPRCPCSLRQAEADRGRFQRDTSCNEHHRECDTFHLGAFTCFNSAVTASQKCCYDDQGELMQTADTMYGGRPSRASPYGNYPYTKSLMVPTLSHWVEDVMPFFFCCKWNPDQDSSDTCDKFKSQRASQDCSSYSSPGVGSVFGDPHFLTFDRVNYTFNGRGEFVLTRVEEKYHNMDIQARFEQISKRYSQDPPINGTVLTAIVARDNQSSVVEFRLRPSSARRSYQLYVIVDRQYIYFPDDSLQRQTFRGVTLYQAIGPVNMSHIVATFESGVGVEVKSGNGYMSADVFLPTSFKRKTRGLLGNWSDTEKDDFAIPNGNVLVTSNATTRQIHKDFGNYWRLSEEEKKNVGVSLFYHDGVPFADYDDPSFEPEFGNPPEIPANFNHFPSAVNQVCGPSMACRYDFIVTGNKLMADMTKMQERNADTLAQTIRQQEIRCPALRRPVNGRKSTVRNTVGSEVHFTCDEGYELVGAQNRKCMPNGQWSWGLDSDCIVDDKRR